MSRRLLAATMLLWLWTPSIAAARPARPAPALPPPGGAVVRVATEPALQDAVRNLQSGETIELAAGAYRLTRSLAFVGPLSAIAIRGATGVADDVVIVGPGMRNTGSEVPYGIWTGGGVDGLTIANVTLRDFPFHPIIFNGGTDRPRVYNVRLVDAGQQFIKSNPRPDGVGASHGVVEYSTFEYSDTARDDYPKGIDIHGGDGWIIRHNLFRNLIAPVGQLMGPSVLVWRGSTGTLVEGNTFINCARGIMFGGDGGDTDRHTGGVIRNNVFYRAPRSRGDAGIHLAESTGTQVLHNTVFVSGTYPSPIEYRHSGTSGVLIANNLLDGHIWRRNGASGTEANNVHADTRMFVDTAAGDFRLAASAGAAIDAAAAVGVGDDWDGDARPSGARYDAGADERLFDAYAALAPSPADVSPLIIAWSYAALFSGLLLVLLLSARLRPHFRR